MKERPNVPHYTQGGIECIDAIQAALTPEEFKGFLKGNAIKYLWRMNHKGAPAADVQKAAVYVGWLSDAVSLPDQPPSP